MRLNIETALDHFVASYEKHHLEREKPLVVQFDPDWISPCHKNNAETGEWVNWLPSKRSDVQDFSHFEQALELDLDPQLKTYFSRYWSNNLNAQTQRGELQLLLPWNEEDFDRLQQNLVGHVLMKRRLGQAETLFFGLTDADDFILSVLNNTGQVVLEQVGLEPQEILAENLADFISGISPRSN